tara:strand:+ start:3390 stop:3740 length:351 start_codon:yes stop_codon:yes gene_type:complete
MAKIVQVANAMISNKEKIENVLRNEKEYFFLYNNKHKWSITISEEEEYFLHFYPTDVMSIEELAVFQDWNNFNQFVTYSTKDIKTQEATETFRELYQIVSDKVYGLDDIFDEIINE